MRYRPGSAAETPARRAVGEGLAAGGAAGAGAFIGLMHSVWALGSAGGAAIIIRNA